VLAFKPEDGAEVVATGKLTIYPGGRSIRSSSSDWS
jgi:exonuclease VII large subunit